MVDLDVLESPLLELVDHRLGTGTGVGEDQGGLVLVDQLLEAVVHH